MSMGGQRRRRHDEGGHGFLIHGEGLRNQGVERTTRGRGNGFLIHGKWEMVGIEGGKATEEGRGHEFSITWERVGNEGEQAMEEGRGEGHDFFRTSEFLYIGISKKSQA